MYIFLLNKLKKLDNLTDSYHIVSRHSKDHLHKRTAYNQELLEPEILTRSSFGDTKEGHFAYFSQYECLKNIVCIYGWQRQNGHTH